MFFAINPPRDTLPAQIAQEFAELHEDLRSAQPQVSLRLYALVDGAFDESFFGARYPWTVPPRSLYADTALQSLGTAAPHLLAAPDGMHNAQEWLGHLFSVANGKPMLSIIASPLSGEELARHMLPYLVGMTPDTVDGQFDGAIRAFYPDCSMCYPRTSVIICLHRAGAGGRLGVKASCFAGRGQPCRQRQPVSISCR